MTTKTDLLYDAIKPHIDSLYSDELENPMMEIIINDYVMEFLKNMDEDNLQDDLKQSKQRNPKDEALDDLYVKDIKNMRNIF